MTPAKPLTIAEVAARWHVSLRHVYSLMADGKLAWIAIGKRKRLVPWSAVEQYESALTRSSSPQAAEAIGAQPPTPSATSMTPERPDTLRPDKPPRRPRGLS